VNYLLSDNNQSYDDDSENIAKPISEKTKQKICVKIADVVNEKM
jgi:hypothetical protein